MTQKSLTRFGTYGFLCALIAAEVALVPRAFASNKVDDTVVEAKKDARSARRKVRKNVRKATGNDSVVEDAKDATKDAVENTKDEARKVTK